MNSIIYSSLAVGHIDNTLLNEMADIYADKNEKTGVTGYLFYFNGRYLLFIESEDDAVFSLMENIRRDHRHTILNEKTYKYDTRLLPGWCMKAIDKTVENLDYAEEVLEQHLMMNKLLNNSNIDISDKLFESIQHVSKIKSRIMLENN